MAAVNSPAHEVEPIEAPTPPWRRMTEDEFVAWCRGFESIRAEWVDGVVVLMSPVNSGHMRLGEFLLRVMTDFVEAHDLGAMHGARFFIRLRTASRLVRRVPDLWFVVKDRLHLIQPTYLDGAPDLIIEIVSPDSIARDWREKYLDYQSAGVREYWVIDPLTKTVEASRRDSENGEFRPIVEADGRVASEVLPGFFLCPEWLWSEPLPKVKDVVRTLGV
jgi:Uma2 family endonuclease